MCPDGQDGGHSEAFQRAHKPDPANVKALIGRGCACAKACDCAAAQR
jgi:hypothetical protein